MVEAKETANWDHTTALMSLIINAFKKDGARPTLPPELNPYRQQADTRPKGRAFEHLKAMIPNGNGRSD